METFGHDESHKSLEADKKRQGCTALGDGCRATGSRRCVDRALFDDG